MVIQRWQSVLLFIVAVVMACFTFMSIGQIQMADYTLDFTTLGFKIEGIPTDGAHGGYLFHTWPFFTVSVLSYILPLVNIFLFKNLKLQKTVCLVEVLLLLGVIAIACTYVFYNFGGPDSSVSLSSLSIAPVLALVADIMAYNRISHDQRALRSADRLR